MPAVALADLIGQPAAAAHLRGVAARGRAANAYLFQGPSGVGKGTAAIAFARALLCDGSPGARPEAAPSLFGDVEPPAAAAPAGDACGRCGACGKTLALQHPDLRFLFPISADDDKKQEEIIAQTFGAWRDDPLFVFTYDKFASIRLSMTKEILRELAFKPYEAARRVIVVRDADLMREDQYSALLKSIEEPGAATVWILTTARPARLPATIRSRCQRVRFAPLAEAVVAGFLRERTGVSAPEARVLAALSTGSLARALALRDSNPLAFRDQALALLEPALQGDASGLWRAVQSVGGFRAGRESLRRLLEFQQLWLRDLLRARYGDADTALVNADRAADVRRQARGIDAAEIRRRLMVLEEALRAIEGNVSPELALFSALRRVADRRTPPPVWPAYATARSAY